MLLFANKKQNFKLDRNALNGKEKFHEPRLVFPPYEELFSSLITMLPMKKRAYHLFVNPPSSH